jgi:predicted deacylase
MTMTLTEVPSIRRELGSWDSGAAGPTLCVLAGIHGNEPAGVLAVQRVLGRLQEQQIQITGRIVAFGGNLSALSRGVRFLQRDLNRQWGGEQIARLLARDPERDGDEDREQRALLAAFDRVIRTARGPVVFVDLHTSSADGPPFLCLADTIDNRRVAMSTGVPLILGIEELIDGASLEWWSQHGIVNFAVEGGRHQHPDTVGNHEACLWLLLDSLGILRKGSIDVRPYRAHIEKATKGQPSIVEIVHRHAITEQDRYVTKPGFQNFDALKKGQQIGMDARGSVVAPYDCRIMLPLYQALGDDGFFLARDVLPFWMLVARAMRFLRLDRVVHWLPGVRRDPSDINTILVNPSIARWFVTELFHLLGFRKERKRGTVLAFTRRWSRRENSSLAR